MLNIVILVIFPNAMQVYNVSEFVKKHPGGIDQIMLGAGRDITQLFECYHKLEIAK